MLNQTSLNASYSEWCACFSITIVLCSIPDKKKDPIANLWSYMYSLSSVVRHNRINADKSSRIV